MLGCQDFCGYYDWTFHYVDATFGPEALQALWADAIGGDSQKHYEEAARRDGLKGLYSTWCATGEDEHCDWTFTLDENRNVLRWDMRRCPSKGFLLANDLNASEDYCDHCMGWTVPLLNRAGFEVVGHEHNHCGQCWGEMRRAGEPSETLELACDIRQDARWNHGFIERWDQDVKQPLLPGFDARDPAALVQAWFQDVERLLVVGRGPGIAPSADVALLMTDERYVHPDSAMEQPRAVLLDHTPVDLQRTAKRFLDTMPSRRPLLLHAYLPGTPPVDFVSAGLPRPVPLLPLLIRTGVYRHRPGAPATKAKAFLVMLAVALGKPAHVSGIEIPESLLDRLGR